MLWQSLESLGSGLGQKQPQHSISSWKTSLPCDLLPCLSICCILSLITLPSFVPVLALLWLWTYSLRAAASSPSLTLHVSASSREGSSPGTVLPSTEARFGFAGSLLCSIFLALIICTNYIGDKPKPCCGPHGNRCKELRLIINQGIQMPFLLQRSWGKGCHWGPLEQRDLQQDVPRRAQPGAGGGFCFLFLQGVERKKPAWVCSESLSCYPTMCCEETA